MELTLVSYNVHSGIGTDGRFDLHRVAEVLAEIGADIIALQEVGDFRGRMEKEAHPEHLAEQLGLHMAFGPNVVRNDRRFGNTILSRLPIVRSQNYDLSVKGREPRGALRCDLELADGGQLHVFCVHLGLSMRERRRQESLLLGVDILRDAARPDPLVVCGDFNYWWARQLPALARGAIHDAALVLRRPQRTYHSRFPFLRLDRIYVDSGVRPLHIRSHRTPRSKEASDHLPLVLRFVAPVPESLPVAPPVELIG